MACCTIRIAEYSNSLSRALYHLQKQNKLCDTTLHLRDGQVHVHGVVLLATRCSIFDNLHMFNMNSSQIHIHHFKDEYLNLVKLVIELLYTGKTELPQHCVKDFQRFCHKFNLAQVNEELEKISLERAVLSQKDFVCENVRVITCVDNCDVNCQTSVLHSSHENGQSTAGKDTSSGHINYNTPMLHPMCENVQTSVAYSICENSEMILGIPVDNGHGNCKTPVLHPMCEKEQTRAIHCICEDSQTSVVQSVEHPQMASTSNKNYENVSFQTPTIHSMCENGQTTVKRDNGHVNCQTPIPHPNCENGQLATNMDRHHEIFQTPVILVGDQCRKTVTRDSYCSQRKEVSRITQGVEHNYNYQKNQQKHSDDYKILTATAENQLVSMETNMEIETNLQATEAIDVYSNMASGKSKILKMGINEQQIVSPARNGDEEDISDSDNELTDNHMVSETPSEAEEVQNEADRDRIGTDRIRKIDSNLRAKNSKGSVENLPRKSKRLSTKQRLSYVRKKKSRKGYGELNDVKPQVESLKEKGMNDSGEGVASTPETTEEVNRLCRSLRGRVKLNDSDKHPAGDLEDLSDRIESEMGNEVKDSHVKELCNSQKVNTDKAKMSRKTNAITRNAKKKIDDKESEKHPQRSTSVCYLCDEYYHSVKALREHNIQNHPRTVECNKCGEQVEISKFNQHYRIHHFVCDLCGYRPNGCKETKLAEHKLKKHEEFYNVKRFPILHCEEKDCKFRSVYWTKIQQHRKMVHEPPKYKCDNCDKAFATQSNLRLHSEAVHPTTERQYNFLCTLCPKKFTSQGKLNGHMKFHIKELMCHVCSKCCSTKKELAVHMYTRHGILSPNLRMYKCKQCDYQVYSSWAFKSHMASKHGGSKDFVCQECGKQFYASKNLYDHLKIHKGIKYHCPINGCSFSTIYKSALYKRHIPTVHTGKDVKNSFCHLCEYRCKNDHNLKSHLRYKHKVVLTGQEIKQKQQSLHQQFKTVQGSEVMT